MSEQVTTTEKLQVGDRVKFFGLLAILYPTVYTVVDVELQPTGDFKLLLSREKPNGHRVFSTRTLIATALVIRD